MNMYFPADWAVSIELIHSIYYFERREFHLAKGQDCAFDIRPPVTWKWKCPNRCIHDNAVVIHIISNKCPASFESDCLLSLKESVLSLSNAYLTCHHRHMSGMVSQISDETTVCSTACSCQRPRKIKSPHYWSSVRKPPVTGGVCSPS